MSLDEIDKLGGVISHQGGPYDALSPNRNRNRNRANSDAPVAAFDPDGPNSNPNVYNQQTEKEYHMQPHLEIQRELSDDAPVTGPVSIGLGSTTYVENAPASKQAIIEEQQNTNRLLPPGGMLGRVKSLTRRNSDVGDDGDEGEGLLSRVRSFGRGNRSRSNTASSKREEQHESQENPEFDFESVGTSTTRHSYAETLHHRNK